MSETNLRYRDLFLVLSSELKTLLHYFGDDPKYQMILEVFSEYKEDEYNSMPKQKDLLAQLDLTRTKLMELLRELYHDFKHSIFQAHTYPIKKTEYFVNVETLDNENWQIGLDHLEHIPTVGDKFRVQFIKGEYSFGYFEVKEVHHSIENQVHTVSIFVSDKFDDEDISFIA
ncbi:MAG: hypothetical protein HUJ22_02250 [Gracilimonas sp.]|uniref:hypothetical protein n=1 Tax=Gracilimonas sp. TaxID=1974203 RepID=UPI0019CA8545|nr:hypothetical protein [Gracilimonas sp.]MBD3615366.1 hypothetical protein [Gracilimonas sp.]